MSLACPSVLGVLFAGLFAPTLRAQLPEAGDAPVLSPDEWQQWIERDRRIGFTSLTAERARSVLRGVELEPAERALALFALGAAGERVERPRLSTWAAEGSLVERQGAILGLGELGAAGGLELSAGEDLLAELVESEATDLAEPALLSLLRTREPRWRQRAEAIAAEPRHALSGVAADLLVFVLDPAASRETASARRLLELRWEAARHFGTIDGRAWREAMIGDLVADPAFLEPLVLYAAADLRLPGIDDHILDRLLDHGGIACVRSAVRAMAGELDDLVAAELWAPASDEEWQALIDEALEMGVAALLSETFERAALLPSVGVTASGVLAWNQTRFLRPIRAALESEDPEQRRRGAMALADAGERGMLAELEGLREDPDARVRASALVARIRLADSKAVVEGRALLEERRDARPEERAAFIEGLGATWRHPRVVDFVEGALALFDLGEQGVVLPGMHFKGRIVDREAMRASYALLEPGAPESLRLVRAIAHRPSAADVEFLASRFPSGGPVAVDVELALGLVRSGHGDALPLLEHAVWRAPWNLSVLAAAVVKSTAGPRVLHHWIVKPPPSATSADIRRLGFAIGEWGGLEALRELSRALGGGADRPALQGALFGALVGRTH